MMFSKKKKHDEQRRDDSHSDVDRYGRHYEDSLGSDYDDRYDRYERERYGRRSDYDDRDEDSRRDYDDRDDDRRWDYDDRDNDRRRDYDDRNQYDNTGHDEAQGYDIEGYSGESEDEEFYTEASHEATYQSMRKAKRYLIISLIGLVLVAGAGFYLFQSVRRQKTMNQNNCWTCQLTVEERVNKYVKENGLTANPAYLEDVPNAIVDYQCKEGGSYTWYPVSGSYVCSEHGHHPDNFGEQQSQITGTTQTEVPV